MVNRINFVQRQQKPVNVFQTRPIETIWSLLEEKVYGRSLRNKEVKSIGKKVNFEGKAIGSEHRSKTFENVQR